MDSFTRFWAKVRGRRISQTVKNHHRTTPSQMACPSCGKRALAVLETRLVQQGYVVRRRRRCYACGSRFSTVEENATLHIDAA